MKEPHLIEVYQELEILFDASSRGDACAVLERQVPSTAWCRATDVEKRIDEDYDTGVAGVIAFERKANGNSPAVRVVLCPVVDAKGGTGEGGLRYRLGNIVPVELGELGVHGYNDALEAFLQEVVEPAEETLGIEIDISSRQQTMTDWTSKEAADALRRFSAAANMSMGSDHPADEARWWAFVIADHRAQGTLRAGLLRQWLIEADRWPADIASELVSEWEKGRELLAAYDLAS